MTEGLSKIIKKAVLANEMTPEDKAVLSNNTTAAQPEPAQPTDSKQVKLSVLGSGWSDSKLKPSQNVFIVGVIKKIDSGSGFGDVKKTLCGYIAYIDELKDSENFKAINVAQAEQLYRQGKLINAEFTNGELHTIDYGKAQLPQFSIDTSTASVIYSDSEAKAYAISRISDTILAGDSSVTATKTQYKLCCLYNKKTITVPEAEVIKVMQAGKVNVINLKFVQSDSSKTDYIAAKDTNILKSGWRKYQQKTIDNIDSMPVKKEQPQSPELSSKLKYKYERSMRALSKLFRVVETMSIVSSSGYAIEQDLYKKYVFEEYNTYDNNVSMLQSRSMTTSKLNMIVFRELIPTFCESNNYIITTDYHAAFYDRTDEEITKDVIGMLSKIAIVNNINYNNILDMPKEERTSGIKNYVYMCAAIALAINKAGCDRYFTVINVNKIYDLINNDRKMVSSAYYLTLAPKYIKQAVIQCVQPASFLNLEVRGEKTRLAHRAVKQLKAVLTDYKRNELDAIEMFTRPDIFGYCYGTSANTWTIFRQPYAYTTASLSAAVKDIEFHNKGKELYIKNVLAEYELLLLNKSGKLSKEQDKENSPLSSTYREHRVTALLATFLIKHLIDTQDFGKLAIERKVKCIYSETIKSADLGSRIAYMQTLDRFKTIFVNTAARYNVTFETDLKLLSTFIIGAKRPDNVSNFIQHYAWYCGSVSRGGYGYYKSIDEKVGKKGRFVDRALLHADFIKSLDMFVKAGTLLIPHHELKNNGHAESAHVAILLPTYSKFNYYSYSTCIGFREQIPSYRNGYSAQKSAGMNRGIYPCGIFVSAVTALFIRCTTEIGTFDYKWHFMLDGSSTYKKLVIAAGENISNTEPRIKVRRGKREAYKKNHPYIRREKARLALLSGAVSMYLVRPYRSRSETRNKPIKTDYVFRHGRTANLDCTKRTGRYYKDRLIF